jgi:hypothetical protein
MILIIGSGLLLAVENAPLKKTTHDDNKNIPAPLLRIISIDLENIPLEKALSIITGKGKFKLNYNRRDIPVLKKVSVKMENAPIIEVLKKLLIDTDTELAVTRGGFFAIVPGEKKNQSSGTIRGKVSEIYNHREIPGVYVEVMDSKHSTISDTKGEFKIFNLPTGNYKLKFSADGFNTFINTDVIIRSKRITYVNVKMDEQLPAIKETVEVSANYFHKCEKNPVSVVNISAEEVRRSPGTGGGITRMLKILPGITTASDEDTDLAVRGGNPYENGYIIDNIEIPVIDHLPNFISSGGSYSALNADLIQHVDFYTGGFSGNYNGYLSAVTDITLREGNRSEFDGQLNLDMVGAGFIFEGPISKDRGAWLVAFRKSYLQFMKNLGLLDVGGAIASIDGQLKMTYDISPTQKISLLYFTLSGEVDEGRTGIRVQANENYAHHTLGINWISNWSQEFFSNTSLAFSSIRNLFAEGYAAWDPINLLPGDTAKIWDVDDVASRISLRNSNYLVLNNQNKLKFGLQVKYESDKLKEVLYPILDAGGNWSQSQQNNYTYHTTKFGLFFSYIGNHLKRLTTTIGLRGDYSSIPGRFHLSPRFSLRYEINPRLSLGAGVGVFYQTLPMAFLAYTPGATGLKDMKATHYVLGMEWLPGRDTKFTLEGYIKDYENLPISPDQEKSLAMDYAVGRFRSNIWTPVGYRAPKTLADGGSGYSRGIELLIQKKLVEKFYGFLSASYFRCRYKDLNGDTHNRVYDNRFTLNMCCGYKPNRFWEFSAKWTLLGGGPYTPIDLEASRQADYWILDDAKFLQARYPPYNSVSVRVDKRFYFKKTSLTIFVDIWNVFDRKNVLYYWYNIWEDVIDSPIMPYNQMGILPILGIEFEF